MKFKTSTLHVRAKSTATTIAAAAEYVGAEYVGAAEQSIFNPEPSNALHVSAGKDSVADVPVQSELVKTCD